MVMPSAKKTTGSKKNLFIGKIYADWCGHCKTLIPEWNKMKKQIQLQMGRIIKNIKIQFFEIGDTEANKKKGLTVDKMISDFNEKHLANNPSKLALQGGYPTLFRYCNGKLEYYQGERNAQAMWAWYKSACETGSSSMKGGAAPKTSKRSHNKKRSRRTVKGCWSLW
jgi:thiol-disulfide isomerase/thioredoxin